MALSLIRTPWSAVRPATAKRRQARTTEYPPLSGGIAAAQQASSSRDPSALLHRQDDR